LFFKKIIADWFTPAPHLLPTIFGVTPPIGGVAPNKVRTSQGAGTVKTSKKWLKSSNQLLSMLIKSLLPALQPL